MSRDTPIDEITTDKLLEGDRPERKIYISILDSLFITVWLGIMLWCVVGQSLDRIADALDRAYPK